MNKKTHSTASADPFPTLALQPLSRIAASSVRRCYRTCNLNLIQLCAADSAIKMLVATRASNSRGQGWWHLKHTSNRRGKAGNTSRLITNNSRGMAGVISSRQATAVARLVPSQEGKIQTWQCWHHLEHTNNGLFKLP